MEILDPPYPPFSNGIMDLTPSDEQAMRSRLEAILGSWPEHVPVTTHNVVSAYNDGADILINGDTFEAVFGDLIP